MAKYQSSKINSIFSFQIKTKSCPEFRQGFVTIKLLILNLHRIYYVGFFEFGISLSK